MHKKIFCIIYKKRAILFLGDKMIKKIILFSSIAVICGYLIGFNVYKEGIFLNEKKETVLKEEEKITPSTKMVYVYNYTEDSVKEVFEDVPPYFLINKTRQEIEEDLSNWQVDKFSNKEVVLSKSVQGQSNQHYIISEYDGLVAIYYENEIEGNNLMDITDIYVDNLPEEIKSKLKEGIKIKGKSNLNLTIQDLES